jgi:hypothetical protein
VAIWYTFKKLGISEMIAKRRDDSEAKKCRFRKAADLVYDLVYVRQKVPCDC